MDIEGHFLNVQAKDLQFPPEQLNVFEFIDYDLWLYPLDSVNIFLIA
jgi:hypothetical protein